MHEHMQPAANTPQLALVLGSGGVRSIAALGIADLLTSAGLKTDLVVGCSSVALFGACVAPGADCTTAEDCADTEYCELALGEPGGGKGVPPPGLVCTQPLPPSGACIVAPTVCGDPGADPETCLEPCEVQIEPGAR